MKLVEIKEGDKVVVLQPKDVIVAMESTDIAIVIKNDEEQNLEVHRGRDVQDKEEATSQSSLLNLFLIIASNREFAQGFVDTLEVHNAIKEKYKEEDKTS